MTGRPKNPRFKKGKARHTPSGNEAASNSFSKKNGKRQKSKLGALTLFVPSKTKVCPAYSFLACLFGGRENEAEHFLKGKIET